MKRTAKPWGTVYRRTSRGKLTRYWWLIYQFPGEPRRRHSTNPPVEDKAEAERQLHAILGQRGYERRERRASRTRRSMISLTAICSTVPSTGGVSRSVA